MTLDGPLLCAFAAGAATGALAVFVTLHAKMTVLRNGNLGLRGECDAAQAQLAEMRAQSATLRHDLRGILSPAMLSADRLTNSQDPAIRKAADIVIRTVERAAARLAETRPAQDSPKSPAA